MIDLKRLAFDNELGQKELGEILGIKQSQVSLMVNGRRDITPTHIDLLKKHFGEETINAYTIDDNIINVAKTPQARTITATVIPAEAVEDIRSEVQEKLEEELIPPIIPSVILHQPEQNLAKWVDKNADNPAIDTFNIISILKLTKFVIHTDDCSMSSAIKQGEYVLANTLALGDNEINSFKVTDGKVYGVDTKNAGAFIRILYDQGDSVRAVPINKKYGEMVIKKSDIYGIYRPLFHGSTQIIIEPDSAVELEQKEMQVASLMEELSKAVSLIDRLIEQNNKLIAKLLEKQA